MIKKENINQIVDFAISDLFFKHLIPEGWDLRKLGKEVTDRITNKMLEKGEIYNTDQEMILFEFMP
jgi:hypothetical protein